MPNYVSYVPDLEDEEIANSLTFDFDKFMPNILEGEKNKTLNDKDKLLNEEAPTRTKR